MQRWKNARIPEGKIDSIFLFRRNNSGKLDTIVIATAVKYHDRRNGFYLGIPNATPAGDGLKLGQSEASHFRTVHGSDILDFVHIAPPDDGQFRPFRQGIQKVT